MSKTHTIITIGRQFGSGGREIGKRLADELEIEFYDKELLSRAAKDSSNDLTHRILGYRILFSTVDLCLNKRKPDRTLSGMVRDRIRNQSNLTFP